MLCIKCNCLASWFQGWIFCPECEHAENATLPDDLTFDMFIALAFGEDFYV